MNTHSIPAYDDEIDLRAIFQTLWKARVAILVLTLTAALVAFVSSAWLLPKQYQAVAYVNIGQPTVRYAGQDYLSAVPTAPDIKALPELAKTEAVMIAVAKDARVVSLSGANEKIPVNQMEVNAIGTSQLRFEVTDANPQLAAALATVWAEKAAEWIEINYGLGMFSATLDAQALKMQQDYAQAQSALETFLEQDRTPIVLSVMEAQQAIYACLERRTSAADALLKRLTHLEISMTQSADAISLSNALLLSSIRQDIDSLETCGSSAVLLQAPSPTLFYNISSMQGLDVISGMRQSLQKRIGDTKIKQGTLQEEILNYQVELEQLGYKRAEYAFHRDQAKALYEDLAYQQAVMESVLQQSGRVADVSAEAVVPQNASSPKPLVNTAVAGMLGLMLGALGVLGVDWWKKAGTSA